MQITNIKVLVLLQKMENKSSFSKKPPNIQKKQRKWRKIVDFWVYFGIIYE
jgi:VanZ family protein